jgi:hypothetical protein
MGVFSMKNLRPHSSWHNALALRQNPHFKYIFRKRLIHIKAFETARAH